MSFDHGSPLSPLPSFAIREDYDDEKLHIDGVGFIVNGVQSIEEGEKERESRIFNSDLSPSPSLSQSLSSAVIVIFSLLLLSPP